MNVALLEALSRRNMEVASNLADQQETVHPTALILRFLYRLEYYRSNISFPNENSGFKSFSSLRRKTTQVPVALGVLTSGLVHMINKQVQGSSYG